MHGDIDFKSLREKTHLTLSGLAELSEYGPADILRLERGEKVSRSMRETVFVTSQCIVENLSSIVEKRP